jgi:phytoene desaturase
MKAQSAEKRVVVVGAGPGGLTSAMILAHRGFRVTVVEEKPQVGGRNAALRLGPYVFDTGPTFLMLADILREVFQESGTKIEDVLDLRRLDPMYRLQFADKTLEPGADAESTKAGIRRSFPGLEDRYDRFMAQEKTRFARLYPCLQKSYHRARTLLHPDMLRAIPHLALGRSLFSVVRKAFGDDDLALSFTFQAKYLGMSPWECPGVFAMVPYIEHAFGIYHPIGGLSRISDVMADVARGNGADIRLNARVEQVLVRNGSAYGVRLAGGEVIEADEVVINADFAHAATHLFAPGVLRKYTPEGIGRRKFSCSTFMLYLGLDKVYEDMPHHAIVFSKDYKTFVDHIVAGRPVRDDLSVYVRNASVLDPTLAPKGHSAVYVLVPIANNRSGIDWEAERAGFRDLVLRTIEARTGMKDLRQHIQAEAVITPADWESQYNVHIGATFNLAHNIGQMLYFRPRNKFEEIDHTYLVGGGTHPGSGLPTIYESGRISANLISRHYGVPFVSGNLEV